MNKININDDYSVLINASEEQKAQAILDSFLAEHVESHDEGDPFEFDDENYTKEEMLESLNEILKNSRKSIAEAFGFKENEITVRKLLYSAFCMW